MQLKYGTMLLKMSAMGMSRATELMANTFTPTGGVICPISMRSTTHTPNQMGSNCSARMVGYSAGSVSRIMGMTFIIQPRMM